MLARVLIIVAVNAAFFVAVLWYVPVEGILAARGYTPAQISALKTAGESETDKAPADNQASGTPPGDDTAQATAQQAPENGEQDSQAPQQTQARTATDDGNGESTDQSARPPRLVATDTINVRAGQGTDHDVVGQVSSGEIVTVLDNPGGDWIRIERDDLRGWAYRPLFEAQEK